MRECLLAPAQPGQRREDEARDPALIHSRHGALAARPGETLLDTLERHGQRVEFQCRSGYCGACRTPLLAGRVHYPEPPLAFVPPGQCLPCCCHPQGNVSLDLAHGTEPSS